MVGIIIIIILNINIGLFYLVVAPLGTITMYGTLTLALPVLLPDACARGMCLAPVARLNLQSRSY